MNGMDTQPYHIISNGIYELNIGIYEGCFKRGSVKHEGWF